jgi:chromosome segregation ATPase
MEKIKKELSNLSEQIDVAKKEIAKLEGREQEALKTLHKEFKIKTVEDGEDLLKEMDQEVEELEEDIKKDFKILKEKYDW